VESKTVVQVANKSNWFW